MNWAYLKHRAELAGFLVVDGSNAVTYRHEMTSKTFAKDDDGFQRAITWLHLQGVNLPGYSQARVQER